MHSKFLSILPSLQNLFIKKYIQGNRFATEISKIPRHIFKNSKKINFPNKKYFYSYKSVNSNSYSMFSSPYKPINFDEQPSPSKKKIVQNEINSWMQTCVKKSQSLRRQKLPCKFIINRSLGKQEELSKLKKYRNSLVMEALEKYSHKTNDKENDKEFSSLPYASEKYNKKGKQALNVEVSQFNEKQTHQIISFNEHTKITLLKLPQLSKKRTLPLISTHYQDYPSNPLTQNLPKKSYIPLKYLINKKLASITKI